MDAGRFRLTVKGLLLAAASILIVAGDIAAQPASELVAGYARAVSVVSMTVEFEGLALSVKRGFTVPLILDSTPTGAILLGEIDAQVTLPPGEDGSGPTSELEVVPRFVFLRLSPDSAASFLADAAKHRSSRGTKLGTREVTQLISILDECRSDSFWQANVGEHAGDSLPAPEGEGHIDLLMNESKRWCLEWDARQCRLWDYFSSDPRGTSVYLRKAQPKRTTMDLRELRVEAAVTPAENEINLDVNYVIELEEPSSELDLSIHPALRIERVSDRSGHELKYSQLLYLGPLVILGESQKVTVTDNKPHTSWDIRILLTGVLPPYNYDTQEGVHDMYFVAAEEIRFNLLWLHLRGADSVPGVDLTTSLQLPPGFRPVIATGDRFQLDYALVDNAMVVADSQAGGPDVTLYASAKPSVTLPGPPEIEVVYTLPEEREVAENVAEYTADAAQWLTDCLGAEAMPIKRVAVLRDYHDRMPWRAWGEGLFTVNQSMFQGNLSEDYLRRGTFHELSHTTFGYELSPAGAEDSWLEESLPVFLEHVYFGDSPDLKDLRSAVLPLSTRYLEPGIEKIARNRESSGDLGMAIINLLRRRFGDKAIMAGVQALVRAGELNADLFLDAVCKAVGAPLGEDIEYYLTCSALPSLDIDWEASPLSLGYRLTVFPQPRNFGPISCNIPLTCVCEGGGIHMLELPVDAAANPASFFIPEMPVEVYLSGPPEDALVITPDLFYRSLNANMQPAKNKLYFKNDLRGAALHLRRIQARKDRAEITLLLAKTYLDLGDRSAARSLFLTLEPAEIPDYCVAQYESFAKKFGTSYPK